MKFRIDLDPEEYTVALMSVGRQIDLFAEDAERLNHAGYFQKKLETAQCLFAKLVSAEEIVE